MENRLPWLPNVSFTKLEHVCRERVQVSEEVESERDV
jgi:hypothetical protein